MRLIPILALTILLATPIGPYINAEQFSTVKDENIVSAYEKARTFQRADLFNTTTLILTSLMESYGDVNAPVICDIQMPKRMWWLTLVAAKCTGADPNFVASVLRFESDFRIGPIGKGTYVGPGGIKYTYRKKYPIDDLFGNILTVARRLAMFDNMHAALAGYNKDRSPEYKRYCRSVTNWTNKLRKDYKEPAINSAWNAAITLGHQYLEQLEIKAATYKKERS